jgi:ankyrin repeat protein
MPYVVSFFLQNFANYVLFFARGPRTDHGRQHFAKTCDTLQNFAASFILSEKVTTILRWADDLYDPHALTDYFNVSGENFVHRAAAMNNVHAVIWATTWQGGRLMNSRDKRGRTPLFHAAAAGSVEICQVLLENGADPNIADEFGRTPLCVACWHNHRDSVEILLKSISSPEQIGRSIDQPTPNIQAWHFAALSDDVDLLNLLGTYKPYVEAPDKDAERNDSEDYANMTPLHIASSLGLMESVMFLAHETSNFAAKTKFAFVPETVGNLKPRIETSEPRTAEEWARARGFEKVAAFLEAVSANASRAVTTPSLPSSSIDGP